MTRQEFRAIRKELKLTQAAFGRALGLSSHMVSMVERGARNIRRPNELAIVGLLCQLRHGPNGATPMGTTHGGSDGPPHEWDFQPIE
jgi:DNA-binding XRE family transcriptional regulator